MTFERETIAAIATGLTDSGIGIIRISGSDAVKTGTSLFRSPSGKAVLEHGESHRLYYGYIVEKNSEDAVHWKDDIIDEVMAVVMKAPRSFTGEDTVEIQCHGGVLVMQKILEAVLKAGARLAEPGEFTKRAFLNGRIDLTRAEAVMDVIHSQNEYALAASVNQLRGMLYENIKELRSEILYEIAFIESALDDPEHISLEGFQEELEKKLNFILKRIEKLLSTADNGKLIKEGINTVIVGKPNAGKSSFMNLLVGEERAIVTEIAGTTRDVLRESVRLQDISLNIVDTAGIHDTEDAVEKIGVERAKKYAAEADLLLYAADTSVPLDEKDRKIIPILENKKFVVLLNKSDIGNAVTEKDIRALFGELLPEEKNIRIVKTSAKEGQGLEEFEQTVRAMFFQGEMKLNQEVCITNMRHKEALQEAQEALLLVKKSIEEQLPEDFYSIDLMSAYSALGRIIGEEVDEDLADEIFSKFCMGK